MAIPYAPSRLYQPDSSIADLILRAGQQQAEGQRRGGEIWGGLAQNLGSIASGTIRDIAERKRLAPIEAAEQKARTDRNELTGIQLAGARSEQGATTAASEAMKSGGSRASVLAQLSGNPEALAKAEAYYERADARSNAQHADSAMQLIESGFDPFVVKGLAADMEERGYDKKVIQQYEMMAKGDPRKAEQFFSGIVSRSKDPAAQAWLTRRTSTHNASLEAEDRKATREALATRTKVDDDRADKTFGESVRHNRAMESKPSAGSTPSYQPKLIIVDGKEVQANYDSNTGKYHDPDTGAVLKGIQSPPTADMRNKTEGRKLVKKSVSSIRTVSEGILTKVGPAQRAMAIKRGAEAVFGDDPAFRTYQDARTALAGNLAVAQQGSRPSDADIKSVWLPLVPDPYRDTKESAEMKWNLIEQMSNIDEPKPKKTPPNMVKYQGKTVPFSSLPPAVQAQVLELQDK